MSLGAQNMQGLGGWTEDEALTDSMNDLMYHNLAKLKLLVLLVNVLGDDGHTLAVSVKAIAVAVDQTLVLIVAIQSANPGRLADTSISLGSSSVVLPS